MILPKVSIIVPVFNTGPYLTKCLDSLCAQTLKEIEIIIVNDGSTDDSDFIIKSYLDKDRRIKYIYLPNNKGTFYARTTGLLNSTGVFIATVDSDDWVDERTFEKMYYSAITHNVEIVECRFWVVDEKNLKIYTFRWADHFLINLSGESILRNVLNRKIWHIAANKIFHRKLAEKSIWFYKSIDKKIVVADDKLLTIPMFFYSSKYLHLPDRFYYYRQRCNSSTNNRNLEHDLMHIRDTYNVDSYLSSFLKKENGISFLKDLQINIAGELRLMFKNISQYNEDSYERDQLYSEIVHCYGYQSLKSLHGDLEMFFISNGDRKNSKKLIKNIKQYFLLTVKCATILLNTYLINLYHKLISYIPISRKQV